VPPRVAPAATRNGSKGRYCPRAARVGGDFAEGRAGEGGEGEFVGLVFGDAAKAES